MKLLDYEKKNMDLEKAMECYPVLIKKFRLLKKHAVRKFDLKKKILLVE